MTYLTKEECLNRFPKLIHKCRQVANLNETEAACAVRDYLIGRNASNGFNPFATYLYKENGWTEWGNDMLRYGGGEAVCHFGGPLEVILAAIRMKHCEFVK